MPKAKTSTNGRLSVRFRYVFLRLFVDPTIIDMFTKIQVATGYLTKQTVRWRERKALPRSPVLISHSSVDITWLKKQAPTRIIFTSIKTALCCRLLRVTQRKALFTCVSHYRRIEFTSADSFVFVRWMSTSHSKWTMPLSAKNDTFK